MGSISSSTTATIIGATTLGFAVLLLVIGTIKIIVGVLGLPFGI